jgi:voltage-gated potassium channel
MAERELWRQETSGRITHRFEPVMLVLALLVIPVVLIEESSATHGVKLAAAIANWAIWVGFAAELVLVLVVAPRKRAALRAHLLELGIVIFTPPFFPRALSSFRFARLIRVLRLARLGMLGARAVQAERGLTSRTGFRYLALLTAFLVAVAGAVISVVDSADVPNIGTGMWWAIVTVTTVGYGDVQIHTTAGRIVGSLLMLAGIGFISLLTATIASTFVAADAEADEHRINELLDAVRRIEDRLEQLSTPG